MGRLLEKRSLSILAPRVDCDRHGQQMKKRHKHPLEENALVRLSKSESPLVSKSKELGPERMFSTSLQAAWQ